ncbi:uncharacterized protein PG986_004973 [Apiospora aurea]|uniref:Mid2 domain-containing protein n=1 Tax=Apiospora aurea TaxID=335848 RepID=A0ABR1QHP3_9PEZI
MMACGATRGLILALATPLLAAECFFNTDWKDLVQGRPVVLAWDALDGGFWDIFLNGDVRSQASLVGPIARNVTQNSVVWLPPDDIRDRNADRLFAVQLWDLARGTVCNSPSFRFKPRSSDEPPESTFQCAKYADLEPQLPSGPVVTTSVSLEHGAVSVVATIAPSFTTGGDPPPTDTTTGGPDAADRSADGTHLGGIIAGAIIGTLFVALLAVSGLLWRAKRKRAKEWDTALPNVDKDEAPSTAQGSMAELGEGGRPAVATAEMQGDQEMRFEMEGDVTNERLHEMPAASSTTTIEPVELPAELPAELLARHADASRCRSIVSALTTDSRRSSLDRTTRDDN